jgi:hypothetical protein
MIGAAQYTYNRFTADDIKKGLINSPQQLWIAYDEGGSLWCSSYRSI